MLQTLRRVGDSLVVSVPKAFVEQNRLYNGSQVELSLDGCCVKIEAPNKRRYKLEELLTEMSEDKLPEVEGW